MATHSSVLTWRIPWTEEPGRLQSMGSQRVGYNLRTKQQQNTTQRVTASALAILFRSCPSPAPQQSQHQWSGQSFPLLGHHIRGTKTQASAKRLQSCSYNSFHLPLVSCTLISCKGRRCSVKFRSCVCVSVCMWHIKHIWNEQANQGILSKVIFLCIFNEFKCTSHKLIPDIPKWRTESHLGSNLFAFVQTNKLGIVFAQSVRAPNSWQECVTRHVITQSAPFSDSHVNGVLSPRFSRLPALLASEEWKPKGPEPSVSRTTSIMWLEFSKCWKIMIITCRAGSRIP